MAAPLQSLARKRTTLLVSMSGTGLSQFMTSPWQLFPTWGILVGVGAGAGAVHFTAAVANCWFFSESVFRGPSLAGNTKSLPPRSHP